MNQSDVWQKVYGKPLTVGTKVVVSRDSEFYDETDRSPMFVNAIQLNADGETLKLTLGSKPGELLTSDLSIRDIDAADYDEIALDDPVPRILDNCFNGYHFGDHVVVTSKDQWQTPDMDDGLHDHVCVAYLDFEDEPDDTIHICSFHVKLDPVTHEVHEVYALLTSNGAEIGFYDEMSTQGFESGLWYITSSFDQAMLSGPYETEEEADADINSQERLAGGVTYLHTPSKPLKPKY